MEAVSAAGVMIAQDMLYAYHLLLSQGFEAKALQTTRVLEAALNMWM